MIQLDPIAHFHTESKELYELPSQGSLRQLKGEIIFDNLSPQSFEDLAGFDYLWVIFLFHKAKFSKDKIFPPRGDKKVSVLASRSPHRPNPIGISCVKIDKIISKSIHVSQHDLLDGTPILDIKPYLHFADSFPQAAMGWIDQVSDHQELEVLQSPRSNAQFLWLQENSQWPLRQLSHQILSKGIRLGRDRIKGLHDDEYELSCKSYRLRIEQIKPSQILIKEIYSGYEQKFLESELDSKWHDGQEHRTFSGINWTQYPSTNT